MDGTHGMNEESCTYRPNTKGMKTKTGKIIQCSNANLQEELIQKHRTIDIVENVIEHKEEPCILKRSTVLVELMKRGE